MTIDSTKVPISCSVEPINRLSDYRKAVTSDHPKYEQYHFKKLTAITSASEGRGKTESSLGEKRRKKLKIVSKQETILLKATPSKIVRSQ